MRIIKLSDGPDQGFSTLDDVQRFFRTDIWQRTPPGKFEVPAGWIAEGRLVSSECLIFTYQVRVVYTARAGSGLIRNDDDQRPQYPSYFVVEPSTLREANVPFRDFEKKYNEATGSDRNLVGNQGWNILPDTDQAAALWVWLGGSDLIDPGLRVEEGANPAERNDRLAYQPDGIDRRPIVERQIRERRGQQEFRDAMRRRYQNRCAVTGCEVLAVLEAAHINPYRGNDDNHEQNGLLLRSDVHTLFDLDLLGIEPENLKVELHPDLAKEYGLFAGVTLHCARNQPISRDALRVRYERFLQRRERPV
jgi:HNH endonuclease